MKTSSIVATLFAATAPLTSAISISSINGNTFLSPFRSQNVTNIQGLVTARYRTSAFWIRSLTPDNDPVTSESIEVYSSSAAARNVTAGDIITISSAIVSEYRSSVDYLYLTELTSPQGIVIQSRGNSVEPVPIGGSTSGIIGRRSTEPPKADYTYLDNGDVFGYPNNVSLVSVVNPVLQPRLYGLDFWESLSGEYVTIGTATVISPPNTYGDTWVYGSYGVTGKNDHGGLTLRPGDGQPEGILLVNPLDGTSMPNTTRMGDTFSAITGIITYQYGYYTLQPTTAPRIISSQSPATQAPTNLHQTGGCRGLTIGEYNIENFSPRTSAGNIARIADQICNVMNYPTVVSLQEVQDNNGPTNDNVVASDVSLSTLTQSILAAGCAQRYSSAVIDPVDDTTGGQPGGNIRNAFLYDPTIVRLRNSTNGPGNATIDEMVDAAGHLTYNPGYVSPNNTAWLASRRPLAAEWEFVRGGETFITISNHWTSKGGGSSIQGDARPPVNGGIDQRTAQAVATAQLITTILSANYNTAILALGDFNDYDFVRPLTTFASQSGMTNIDDVTNTPARERYTYAFQNSEQALDHMYLSPHVVANGGVRHQVLHVNTWDTRANAVSDHDPSVAKVDVC